MNGMVVDASIAASWLLDDEVNETAAWSLERMQAGVRVYVPTLWLLEITNVMFTTERRKRIDRRQREEALGRVERLPVNFLAAPSPADLKILQLYMERHRLTAYDAEYLRVAKEQNLLLATLDGDLIAAAKKENVQVATAP